VAPKKNVKAKTATVAAMPYPWPEPASLAFEQKPATAMAIACSTAPQYRIVRRPYLSRMNTGINVLIVYVIYQRLSIRYSGIKT
jgi:hypothetical protein